jgi:glycosyltransferase involved in cell wall biosynthesis
MDVKVLSFCIPTYGQPQKIRETLESLLMQDMDGVEILIRDDNQDSETEKVVSEYLTRLPIIYFHMAKEGVDRAFLFLSKEANGAFVWWFGDDILEPGAISRVMWFLRCNPFVDFMYINSTDITGKHYSLQLGGSRFFQDRNEVLNILKDQLGFCSALLFRKDILVLGLDEAEAYVGTFWVTLYLALHVLTKGNSFYFLGNRNFFCNPKFVGEARWYDPFLVHGVNFPIVVRQFENQFDRYILHKMLADKFSLTWRAVVLARSLGYKTGFAAARLQLIRLLRLYWKFPEFYIAVPMMLIPSSVLVCLYKIRNYFFST